MKKLLLLIGLVSCDQIYQQGKIQNGGKVFNNHCMKCHFHSNNLDLSKMDTTTFEHRLNLTFKHIDDRDRSDLLFYLNTIKK